MECTLATLMACFSWSGLFLDSSIQVQDAGIAYNYTFETWELRGQQWENTRREDIFSDTSQNPYGSVAIGYVVDFPTAQLSLEARHTSSLALEDDKGINSLQLRLRWFPFRRN